MCKKFVFDYFHSEIFKRDYHKTLRNGLTNLNAASQIGSVFGAIEYRHIFSLSEFINKICNGQ